MGDDPEFSAGLARAGAARGWTVESFCTAAAGARRLLERRFDALTVCAIGPRPDLAAARHLHATLPAAPLVVVVDEGRTEVRLAATRAGASELVLRTAGPGEVVAAWDAHLAARDGRPRVLVVSGQAAARGAADAAIASAGCSVRVLADVSGFFEELDTWKPEAVVLDLSAPRPGPWDLLGAMRASARWRELPVLLTARRSDQGDRLRAYAAGAEAVLDLPGSAGELASRVRSLVRRARLAAAAVPARGAAEAPAVTGRRSPATVVLVDASPGLAEMLRFACAPTGADCLVFHDGREALGYLLHGPAPRGALIVFDLDLPNIDGQGAVRRLAHADGHDYRVVATTGSRKEGEQVRALRAGALDCLAKPLSFALFAARMERLLATDTPAAGR